MFGLVGWEPGSVHVRLEYFVVNGGKSFDLYGIYNYRVVKSKRKIMMPLVASETFSNLFFYF